MEKALKFVKMLQATASKNDKQEILLLHKEDGECRQFIKYVLDPLAVYGIQDKKLKKYLGKTETDFVNLDAAFKGLFDVFEYLIVHNTGRDSTVKKVAQFIDSEPNDELKQLYIEAITKKLKVGISESTVNKVWGKGFLNEFKVQLAKKYEEEQHKVIGKKFVLTEKLDGMRVLAFVQGGVVKFFSRQGKAITGLNEIADELLSLPDAVYDGELLIKNEDLYKDREVLQETLKIARKDGDKTGLNFHLFDWISHDDFSKGKSKDAYILRKTNLFNLVGNAEFQHVKVLLNLYVGTDILKITELLAVLEEQGKEGLMLNLDVPYVTKRTDGLLKVKTMKDFDEIVVDVIEGEGKNKGKLGAVLVKYKGHDLKVGSGFTDEQRKLFWDHPEEIVGRAITIQYFRESQNQEGGLSVSFPVFVQVCEEGKTASYY